MNSAFLRFGPAFGRPLVTRGWTKLFPPKPAIMSSPSSSDTAFAGKTIRWRSYASNNNNNKHNPTSRERRRVETAERRVKRQQRDVQVDQQTSKPEGASFFDNFDFARGGMTDHQMFLLFVVFGPALVFGFVVVMNPQWREQVFGNQTQQEMDKKKRLEMLQRKRAEQDMLKLMGSEIPQPESSETAEAASPSTSGS